MDLLHDECGSDGSASAGDHDAKISASKPSARPPGAPPARQRNEQPGVSSAPHEHGEPDVKPSAKHKPATHQGGSGYRTCAACQKSKPREDFGKKQLKKSADLGRCKSCIQHNLAVRPKRAPSAPTGWLKKPSPKESTKPEAKRQKKNEEPKQNPDDLKVILHFIPGSERHTICVDRRKTVEDLKLIVCKKFPSRGLNPNYFFFTTRPRHDRLRNKTRLEHCIPSATKEMGVTLVDRRVPRRLDRVHYSVSLVALMRYQNPYQNIRHPSDIRHLVGKYDILCTSGPIGHTDSFSNGPCYGRNLEALPGCRIEIRNRGTDHIEGSIFGCLGLSDKAYFTFNTRNSGTDRRVALADNWYSTICKHCQAITLKYMKPMMRPHSTMTLMRKTQVYSKEKFSY